MTVEAVNDCWNRIGVRGDRSCAELRAHIHCRNCPVFGAGARQLLDRSPPPGYREQWTRHFAHSEQRAEAGIRSLMIFRIGEEWLALPTAVFDEVAELRPVHALPHFRSGVVVGLVNVRGELLVCVSLARLLGIAHDEGDARERRRIVLPRMLVARLEQQRAVFRVDEVHGVHRYHPQELKAPPDTLARSAAPYARAILPWNNCSVGLLDEGLLGNTLGRRLSSATAT